LEKVSENIFFISISDLFGTALLDYTQIGSQAKTRPGYTLAWKALVAVYNAAMELEIPQVKVLPAEPARLSNQATLFIAR
jgi:hypothetical protein